MIIVDQKEDDKIADWEKELQEELQVRLVDGLQSCDVMLYAVFTMQSMDLK